MSNGEERIWGLNPTSTASSNSITTTALLTKPKLFVRVKAATP